MPVMVIDGMIKVTKSSGSRKGAKRSKSGKPSKVKYKSLGTKFTNHASKLDRLARRLEKRIDRGATPKEKVGGLKIHIKSLREASERWKNKRFK